jgi:hypothetical protein
MRIFLDSEFTNFIEPHLISIAMHWRIGMRSANGRKSAPDCRKMSDDDRSENPFPALRFAGRFRFSRDRREADTSASAI